MGRKVYISFKTEDEGYKTVIQSLENLDFVDKSLNSPINSENEDYIMQKIRSDYLSDSTVTIFLIGLRSSESLGSFEQRYIKRELQASLYSPKNGILGIVLPQAKQLVFAGTYICQTCGNHHNQVSINDQTVVSEFSYNYYIPNNKCAHSEEDRYCVLVNWEDFVSSPNDWIEKAFAKRSAPIAEKTRVRP